MKYCSSSINIVHKNLCISISYFQLEVCFAVKIKLTAKQHEQHRVLRAAGIGMRAYLGRTTLHTDTPPAFALMEWAYNEKHTSFKLLPNIILYK